MNNLGKLNFDDGIRTIEVNDKGEYISFSINDSSLFEKFAELMKWFENAEERVRAFTEDMEKRFTYVVKKEPDGRTDLNTDAILEISRLCVDMSKEACAKIDNIFGEGSCKKVFGDIVPDIRTISEFIKQLSPFLKMAGNERMNRYERRYDASRKGSRSKRNHQRSRKELVRDYGQKQLQHTTGQTSARMERKTN